MIVKEYIKKILEKEYIRFSTSFYAALVLIIKKSNKRLRIYIDYRALNALTIKNRNALFLIKETLVKLCSVRVFTKFNIIIAFNKIHIRDEDKEKTAFLTRYNLFEYLIILFKLYNAFSTFQAFINEILREYLDVFYSIYLNNILIFSNNKEEYMKHVKKILKKLK